MDRALEYTSDWNSSSGYHVLPKMIYKDKWIENKVNKADESSIILKLHGSTNWLTSYNNPEDGELKLLQEISPNHFFAYESNIKPYSTYDGRYIDGYEDYSYGYYPPNLPLKGKPIPDGMLLVKTTLRSSIHPKKGEAESHGLVSMPLIIPPVKNKEYDKFGDLFETLWTRAEEGIQRADQIIIIGYSFPETDYRSNKLFKNAFSKRKNMPEVVIINPSPDLIEQRFLLEFGITKDKLIVIKDYFSEEFDYSKINV